MTNKLYFSSWMYKIMCTAIYVVTSFYFPESFTDLIDRALDNLIEEREGKYTFIMPIVHNKSVYAYNTN